MFNVTENTLPAYEDEVRNYVLTTKCSPQQARKGTGV